MAGSSGATMYSETIPIDATDFGILLPEVLYSFLGPDSALFECSIDDDSFLCVAIRGIIFPSLFYFKISKF